MQVGAKIVARFGYKPDISPTQEW